MPATGKSGIDPRAWVERVTSCGNCSRGYAVCHSHQEQANRQLAWSRSVRRAAMSASSDLLRAHRLRDEAVAKGATYGPDSTYPWPESLLRSVVDSAERSAAGLERSAERRLAATVDNDPAVIASIRSRFVVHYVLHGRRPHDRESERGHSPYPCGTQDSNSVDPLAATRGVMSWRQVTCRRCLASRRELDRHYDRDATRVCPRCFTVRSAAGNCLC